MGVNVMYLLYEDGLTAIHECSQVIVLRAGEAMPEVLAYGNMSVVCDYIRMAAGM